MFWKIENQFISLQNRSLNQKYDLDSKRIADNTLVALTLMIAESRTEEKDVMVKVVVNLINQQNQMMEEWKELFGKYYWNKLKQRLKEERNEMVTNRDQLKMKATDGCC